MLSAASRAPSAKTPARVCRAKMLAYLGITGRLGAQVRFMSYGKRRRRPTAETPKHGSIKHVSKITVSRASPSVCETPEIPIPSTKQHDCRPGTDCVQSGSEISGGGADRLGQLFGRVVHQEGQDAGEGRAAGSKTDSERGQDSTVQQGDHDRRCVIAGGREPGFRRAGSSRPQQRSPRSTGHRSGSTGSARRGTSPGR